MIIKKLPQEFEQARPVMQQIEAAGFEAYFVGGSVRDTILNKPIHDVDIATSAYPEEIKQIFHRTVDTGIEHGTVMILDHGKGYETTTFRTESGYQDFRRPDEVTFVRSLQEDLQRRDFTINALAMKEDGTVIDLFNGLKDLKAGMIRAVGTPQERFHEDALRMMRAIRFASQLDFKIEKKTLAGIQENAALLSKIAVERTRVELEKLLLGENPANGISALIETNLYEYCPMLAHFKSGLTQLLALNDWHLSSETEVWSLLSYAFFLQGKQVTTFLKAWKTSNQVLEDTQAIVSAVSPLLEGEPSKLLLYHTGRERLASANKIANLFGGEIDTPELLEQYDQLPIKSKKQLAINGGQLMKQANLTPGPMIGTILTQLETAVVNGEMENKLESLLEEAKNIAKV
ncbi:poly A polymerase [Paucilactobacillus vaccinostercus DSM 20634]|uniref:CCA-adding enzyme n=1 Tax=Paucilactobacillus vaccinostercus DSM 20634 TaxID=1423813 RepID=A0A0R2AF74_9LACO|nr:CCA tRNA nucleotidyltransferase [Paucilactobacillus vaccinostercus]KRM62521.1 poly A polymerase [Paucilactobacillus vaccinostercus DSM 20634]RRG09691.1 MAG: CCA tRNA nucleotidyltransferase [Lactobacillus sp.]